MSCDCQLTDAERQYWEAKVSLLLSEVCEIERSILKRRYTTSELRNAGKQVLREGTDRCGPSGS